MKPFLFLATLACVVLGTASAQTATYPSKTVRMVVSNPPGGTVDLLPRLLADNLREQLGQSVIVENRAGAAGNMAAEAVFRAEPDGHTFLVSPPPALVINAALYPQLRFDPTAFTPVSVLGTVPNALLVRHDFPADSVAEFIDHAKRNPGSVTYASQGSGSTSHLTAELFRSRSGIDMVHVPYKGSMPALNDLLGGQVLAMFDNLGASLEHVRSGRLKILGVGSPERVTYLPEVPAIAETLPGFDAVTWFGVVAPPDTPSAVATRMSAAIAQALATDAVQARLKSMNVEAVGGTPEDMARFMKSQAAQWQEVIRSAGVKLD